MAVQRDWKCPGPTGRWVPSWVIQIVPASRSFLLADQSHVLPLQELQLLHRRRDYRDARTALSPADRITSAASEPKATKAAL